MKIKKRDKATVDQYRLSNWHKGDEMHKLIQWDDWKDLKKKQGFDATDHTDLHVHHIWGGTAHRFDVPSNLVLIKSLTHEYLHNMPGNYFTNVLIGTYIKVRDGTFNREVMRYVAGRDVIGYIESMDCMGQEWLEELQLFICEAF